MSQRPAEGDGQDQDVTDLRRSNRLAVAERCNWPAGVLEECDRAELVHSTWTAAWPDDAAELEWLDRDHPGWNIGWASSRSGATYSAGWRGGDQVRQVQHDGLPRGRPWLLAQTLDELAERIAEIERHIVSDRVERARLAASVGRW